MLEDYWLGQLSKRISIIVKVTHDWVKWHIVGSWPSSNTCIMSLGQQIYPSRLRSYFFPSRLNFLHFCACFRLLQLRKHSWVWWWEFILSNLEFKLLQLLKQGQATNVIWGQVSALQWSLKQLVTLWVTTCKILMSSQIIHLTTFQLTKNTLEHFIPNQTQLYGKPLPEGLIPTNLLSDKDDLW